MTKIIMNFKLLFFIAFTFQVNAQITNYKEESLKENANFFEIVNKTRKEFSTKRRSSRRVMSKKQKKAIKQFERWVWIWKDRVNSDGSFIKNSVNKEAYINLLLDNSNTKYQRSNTVTSWEQIGPKKNVLENGYTTYPGLGRVNVVATDANNTQVMYAGSAAGGLWKTTDGGTTWLPKTDDLAGLGVTDIIIDPQNSNILYMATGDQDGGHVNSIGLFKSTDAGENWAVTGLTFSLTDNEYIRDLSFAPNSSTTIYALTNNEIQKSTDSGATWVNMNTVPDYSGDNFQTIIFDPNNANKVVVSDAYGGLWYSSDGGANFSEHSVLQGSTQNKLKLTASANDTENFYGITQDGVFTIFRFDNTDTAADKISETTIANFNSQWGYNQCIAVSPTNKDDILVGGVNVYKSTDNGTSFSMYLNAYDDPVGVGFYVHPDHHYLSFLADGVTVINSHDGGVHKGAFTATKATGGWTDLSDGLVISQPYNIAITEGLNGDDYMMANQDNDGFSKVSKGGRQKWVACSAGDGTATGIDISDSNIRYLGGTYGALYRTNDGYSSSAYSAVTILSDSNDADFISPLALHPTIATTIYAGHGDVKKSTDRGATWAALNTSLVETSFLDVSLYNGATRIFAIGYLGTDKTLRRSNDDGATWVTISNPASNLSINSVYAVPNTAIVYATVASYKAGEKIYKSIDNGASWVSISGNMPNIIMKKILVDPNKNNETIYVGTELGLYYTNNTTTNWTKLGAGLPNVIISDIKVSKSNGNVYVGTFGRGMWVYNDQKHFKSVTNNNWSETTNWEGKTLPTSADAVVIKQEQDVVSVNVAGATVKSLEINNAKLEIKNTNSLTVVNDFVSTINDDTFVSILSDGTASGVFMVNGNATGNLKYQRGGLLANKWSLISPPVIGEKIKGFATKSSNDIRKNASSKYAISRYNDANSAGTKWSYFDQNIDENVKFENGIGYAISRGTTGAVTFSGTMQNATLNVTVSSDKWNAIGNPFTAYYPANKSTSEDFIKNNTTKLADNAQAIYLWENNQNKYVAYTNLASSTQKVLAPGQGFFIKTKSSSTDENVVFKKANIGTKTTLEGNHTFNRSATSFVKVFIEKDEKDEKEKIKVNTDIIFSKNATQGFDVGQDIINFGNATFDLTSKLVNNPTNKETDKATDKEIENEYSIQSVASDTFENQIVPLKLRATSKEKIIFSSERYNLPEDIKVLIEDKKTEKFHEINKTKNYSVTLDENSNEFGRFYLHFSKASLKDLKVLKTASTGLKIYTSNNFLQIETSKSNLLTIDLFDMTGKKVLRKKQKSNEFKGINLRSLSKGVYIVKVVADSEITTKKIIVE
ncbi:VPS10 domain-containing protein [Tenacibaculum piscium]|nr:T9SS type A sorting domain-containing protein [Tenacibaculum piscium]MBE7629672.1 T9SS type A sorting domain-containing protein [Tenacibaculum piscium]MBE7670613.1 T9SS type A sorting domain-containing protein [Tenacibaculum piscium]MBE7690588.1 T9SS type A sorting domain-containing protein [Tenacibaculum piscium]